MITVSIADAPVKGGNTGRENSDQYVFTKRSSSPQWSEYTPAAAALPPPASLSRCAARFAGDFIEQLHVIAIHRPPGLPRRVGLSSRPRAIAIIASRIRSASNCRSPAHPAYCSPTGGRLVQRFSSQIEHFQRQRSCLRISAVGNFFSTRMAVALRTCG